MYKMTSHNWSGCPQQVFSVDSLSPNKWMVDDLGRCTSDPFHDHDHGNPKPEKLKNLEICGKKNDHFSDHLRSTTFGICVGGCQHFDDEIWFNSPRNSAPVVDHHWNLGRQKSLQVKCVESNGIPKIVEIRGEWDQSQSSDVHVTGQWDLKEDGYVGVP